jgi:hypothetical protein
MSIERLYWIYGADESDPKTLFLVANTQRASASFHKRNIEKWRGNSQTIIIVYIESQLPP